MRTTHGTQSPDGGSNEAILAHVHRGLLLASASRRIQDPISSQRASSEARHLLTDARRLSDEAAQCGSQDERVRVAIESLSRALESRDAARDH